ncbi:carboxypeptidase Y precursor, putative [Perkinsus marinus ATCC 50983]|uniref:Carboxypeptidase Y, putative n=1 Tax=Perkinsus marinus (strain ATCC 50983 / TXsc) TaxID=423536 RepID=C5LM66_PERM5|nr:carboxypeptidase Y precursor, putative [Perkinsus marinus ATCC 50983]EER02197.1 carboxypeptidase Y precursor, putative [Perkinsus marinus ATCC 50983]|eukprot:XP_002769479.1 carboxypeptidase Y precursor, putative [Perkinsus marinus ATCC 50983]
MARRDGYCGPEGLLRDFDEHSLEEDLPGHTGDGLTEDINVSDIGAEPTSKRWGSVYGRRLWLDTEGYLGRIEGRGVTSPYVFDVREFDRGGPCDPTVRQISGGRVVFGTGKFIPEAVMRVKADEKEGAGPTIDIVGIIIGNGSSTLTECREDSMEWRSYPRMAYRSGTAPRRVSAPQYDRMVKAAEDCVAETPSCLSGHMSCQALYDRCSKKLINPISDAKWSIYDLRHECGPSPDCLDDGPVRKYFNDPAVQGAVGAHMEWRSSNESVTAAFHIRELFTSSAEQQLSSLLVKGISVLLYAGDQDFLCNWLSVQDTAQALEWPGRTAFAKAVESSLRQRLVLCQLPSSRIGAQVRMVGRSGGLGGLTFARVINASHMVPQDAPEAALSLVNDFIYRTTAYHSDPPTAVGLKMLIV